MGQKVNPIGMRLGIIRNWNSIWYAERREFSKFLNHDIAVRSLITERLANASLSDIKIERLTNNNLRLTIFTARPGVVIGKKGEDIERLRAEISKLVDMNVSINIEEIRKPELDATLVAESIARQLERRIMFRRAMKRAVGNAMRLGAEGIKVSVGGRLNGADIARTEWYREGRVPLHTFRADISYGVCEANTTYGKIGIKVWIFKGEKFDQKRQPERLSTNQDDDQKTRRKVRKKT